MPDRGAGAGCEASGPRRLDAMSIERVRDERYRDTLVERRGEAQRDRDRLLGLVSVLGALLPGVPVVAAGLFGLAARRSWRACSGGEEG